MSDLSLPLTLPTNDGRLPFALFRSGRMKGGPVVVLWDAVARRRVVYRLVHGTSRHVEKDGTIVPAVPDVWHRCGAFDGPEWREHFTAHAVEIIEDEGIRPAGMMEAARGH